MRWREDALLRRPRAETPTLSELRVREMGIARERDGDCERERERER